MEEGRQFEDRALALARAIYDPLGLQGARNILGRERDGVFVGDDAINVFEFTTDRSKKKAEKDAGKLVEALTFLAKDPTNNYKSLTGWFVTQDEPGADQREVVRKLGQAAGMNLHCVSYLTLRRRICDIEGYLSARRQAPFGSIAYVGETTSTVDVAPRFQSSVGIMDVGSVVDLLQRGERLVLTGEFGVGKSHAARTIFTELRKRHFKRPAELQFPIHIDLRDCAGLKTPAEILRRHAEEIGFAGDRGLISAWRAGAAILVLDGFDEVIPSRWLGSAINLRQVRWEALSAVRRLVSEAPPGTGVLVAGRGHYFAGTTEMKDALGAGNGLLLELDDFDADQARTFLRGAAGEGHLPEWLPTRPLLLSHLLAAGLLAEIAGLPAQLEPAQAWRALLAMIAQREARIYSSVPPDTIAAVLRRLATAAKVHGDGEGRLGISDLERVFEEVSGRATDEEVLQLLLRLPGLALAHSDGEEVRLFADKALALAAYGEDLAEYLVSPYRGHPLSEPANWSEGTEDLAVEVCALALQEGGIAAGQVVAACDHRMNQQQYDAILLDAIRVLDEYPEVRVTSSYRLEGVAATTVSVSPETRALAATHLRDCLIEVLDLSQAEGEITFPTLERCFIARIDGVSELPTRFASSFLDCEIGAYAAPAATTAGILDLPMALDERVALSVLHKVYAKRGAGRRDSALPRGLEPSARERVAAVTAELVASGYLSPSTRGAVTIYRPVKGRGAEVSRYLAEPGTFSLTALRVGSSS